MQSKYRYEIIIYWSEEDQAYIAEVLNFRAVQQMALRIRKHWLRPRLSSANGSRPQKNWAARFLNPGADCCSHDSYALDAVTSRKCR